MLVNNRLYKINMLIIPCYSDCNGVENGKSISIKIYSSNERKAEKYLTN